MSPQARLESFKPHPDVVIDDGAVKGLSQLDKMLNDPEQAAEQWANAMVENLHDFAKGRAETYNGVIVTDLPWHNQVNEAYKRQLRQIYGKKVMFPDPNKLPAGAPYTVLRDMDRGVRLTLKAFGQEDGKVHTIWYEADKLDQDGPEVLSRPKLPISIITLINQ